MKKKTIHKKFILLKLIWTKVTEMSFLTFKKNGGAVSEKKIILKKYI